MKRTKRRHYPLNGLENARAQRKQISWQTKIQARDAKTRAETAYDVATFEAETMKRLVEECEEEHRRNEPRSAVDLMRERNYLDRLHERETSLATTVTKRKQSLNEAEARDRDALDALLKSERALKQIEQHRAAWDREQRRHQRRDEQEQFDEHALQKQLKQRRSDEKI